MEEHVIHNEKQSAKGFGDLNYCQNIEKTHRYPWF